MNLLKRMPTLLLALLFVIAANAQNQMNLQEAIQFASSNSSAIRQARINIADAEGQIIENRALGIPQIGFTAEYTYFTDIPASVAPAEFFGGPPGEFAKLQFGLPQSFNAGLNLNWLAIDGSYFYGLKAARLFRDYRQNELTAAEKNVKMVFGPVRV